MVGQNMCSKSVTEAPHLMVGHGKLQPPARFYLLKILEPLQIEPCAGADAISIVRLWQELSIAK